MERWRDFFLGELGAAAALTGLLFVAVSVNQARILELGRMADRGLESLVMLLLVLAVASACLVPDQPVRLLGGEVLATGAVGLVIMQRLQRSYLSGVEAVRRPRALVMIWLNRSAVGFVTLSGLVIVLRNDLAGLYALPIGILLSIGAAGANAWVLLIEINR